MVKNYCYIEQIPTELKNVCVEIALLLYDNGGYQSKNTTLKSIKEGNVALTYQSESSAWKENKKTQDKPIEKMSLKARLAEKKVHVAGQGRDENTKNQQREM